MYGIRYIPEIFFREIKCRFEGSETYRFHSLFVSCSLSSAIKAKRMVMHAKGMSNG